MHKELIKHIDDNCLKEMMTDIISMIKSTNHELYDSIEVYIYTKIYSYHFSDWLVAKATSKMVNNDGTVGPKWSVVQTNDIAKQIGVTFGKFNEYDWNYVVNMVYSDYYGILSNDIRECAKYAKLFLEDKDAPEGKAFRYYLAMKHE